MADDPRQREAITAAEEWMSAAKRDLEEATKAYHAALASDDVNEQVAFELFVTAVLNEGDWPEDKPVTWEDWHDLTIESERDAWRDTAKRLIDRIRELGV